MSALEVRAGNVYSLVMNDTPHPNYRSDLDPPIPNEAELLAAMAESDAEAQAGLFLSGDEVMRELRESIARMEGQFAESAPADADPGFLPRR